LLAAVCVKRVRANLVGAVEPSGTVGLHRPRLEDPEFKTLAPADAATVYKRVLYDIACYLDEVEAPCPIIDAMIATGSSEI
jgi:hypothetical protein